ncbi:UDP-N-acetyl-D-mannosamine dehydrogenase [Stutzerimonas balearica]|jgi:UDP-N-acetyl-D-mannosaminuronic acid dehydrogenase|uniref:UDP-N-acetyl-D-mannosamine dehydrogenase n=1 Tax=Stutzerimonas balearica TaxID=74829 RepID=UPI00190AE0B0|nr:UDP-N-acetyl-D-mannosamine dehydrogenase [Stutzerimonas balearica]MBK3748447.1 UDP-N-acetyl-D-mannosamine dehydrogenase [Stutzerimonas balearica]MBK3826644.1 UDP-N-acetyl-D-mannosamine dehydrogenase [Stutzerimonas balearica]MBK3856334.1 UDP-N-acetyl-D-mannosamine dehydrogenase [Stutzerimonas balearica]
MTFDTIAVVGLGYIGLPTAAVLASRKRKVIGIDVNTHTVETINRGEVHIVEPELDMLVHAAVTEGYLRATTFAEPADAFLIAVPTPFKANHEPDLSYIESASNAIASVLKAGDLVILESTSPVGATERMAAWLAKARPDLTFPQTAGEASDIRIAHCPERVLPGKVLRELIENDRVIGGMTNACSLAAERLYRAFVQGECVLTDARTAEMCKLAENSFRDVNIAFANELATICERLEINPWELIALANRHPRVNILQPGPGVGGHCIAIDPWFIVDAAPEQARLIRQARMVNDERPLQVVSKVEEVLARWQTKNGDRQAKVAFLGLSYKANIDDLRSSPALTIVNAVAAKHPDAVLAVEPHLASAPAELHSNAQFVDLQEALRKADILVLLVAHKDFQSVKLRNNANQAVLDTCGAWKGIAI